MKTSVSRPISRFISKTVKDTTIQWKTNRNSYAVCRMVPFSMILNDLE